MDAINSDPEKMIAYVVLRPQDRNVNIFRPGVYPTLETIKGYAATPADQEAAVREFRQRGFEVSQVSKTTLTIRGPRQLYAQNFRIEFENFRSASAPDLSTPQSHRATLVPTEKAVARLQNLQIEPISGLIFPEPVRRFGVSSPPPEPSSKHYLRLPTDVASLLNATSVHESNRGAGIRVGIIDSGFQWEHHPWFEPYRDRLRTARIPFDPGDPTLDLDGHGTGVSSCLLSIAPETEIVGLRDNDAIGALTEVINLGVQVLSCSWGTTWPSDGPNGGGFWTPYYQLMYEKIVEIADAGIIVVFAGGNGPYGYSFTASMPEAISVGGAYYDINNELHASDYTSSYSSTRFAAHQTPQEIHVPEICGLCGPTPLAQYLRIPVPPGCEIDRRMAAQGDGTAPDDGWALFSGSSAACPMVAGAVCLLLAMNPNLSLTEVRKRLYMATDVRQGQSAMGHDAGPGYDLATGHGLLDVSRAIAGLGSGIFVATHIM